MLTFDIIKAFDCVLEIKFVCFQVPKKEKKVKAVLGGKLQKEPSKVIQN